MKHLLNPLQISLYGEKATHALVLMFILTRGCLSSKFLSTGVGGSTQDSLESPGCRATLSLAAKPCPAFSIKAKMTRLMTKCDQSRGCQGLPATTTSFHVGDRDTGHHRQWGRRTFLSQLHLCPQPSGQVAVKGGWRHWHAYYTAFYTLFISG